MLLPSNNKFKVYPCYFSKINIPLKQYRSQPESYPQKYTFTCTGQLILQQIGVSVAP